MSQPTPMTTQVAGDEGNGYTATDEDGRDAATWSLSGVDAASFVLDATTLPNVVGEQRHLRFRTAPDYEEPADDNGDNVYKVTLVATDNSNATAERDITVFVMNANENGYGLSCPTSSLSLEPS